MSNNDLWHSRTSNFTRNWEYIKEVVWYETKIYVLQFSDCLVHSISTKCKYCTLKKRTVPLSQLNLQLIIIFNELYYQIFLESFEEKTEFWVENLTSRPAAVDPVVDPIIGWLGCHLWSVLRSLGTLVHWQIWSSQRSVSHKPGFHPVNHFLRGHYLLFQMFV